MRTSTMVLRFVYVKIVFEIIFLFYAVSKYNCFRCTDMIFARPSINFMSTLIMLHIVNVNINIIGNVIGIIIISSTLGRSISHIRHIRNQSGHIVTFLLLYDVIW